MDLTAPDLPDATLPDVDHRARRDRLRARLAADDVDALYVTHLPNVRWLTGFTGSSAAVLVAVDPALDLLVTDGRYVTQAAVEVPELERAVVRAGGHQRAVQRLAEAGAANVAFEASRLAWDRGERVRQEAAMHHLEPLPRRENVERLRAVKDPAELRALRAACAITDAAFVAILDTLRPGTAERQVATVLERTMVDLGAHRPSFDSIVASGPNAAVPHHRPTDRRLEPGDLVKIDFGAAYAGYHADMTRTIALGDPHPRLRDLHERVREAQAAGVAAATAQAEVGAVDRACRDPITAAGYGEQFVHPSGHGVGLEIHEWPTLVADGRALLQAGMTVTVEPGVYLAGIGGVRIEDTVAISAEGPPEVLTRSPRELLVL
ncbi:MAG: Xaa-Pro peptidase family protein [Actinobacteria bacterium]|nr:Xaa-Pro peptidase family protein [Actinomycetota bacterium]